MYITLMIHNFYAVVDCLYTHLLCQTVQSLRAKTKSSILFRFLVLKKDMAQYSHLKRLAELTNDSIRHDHIIRKR